MFKILFAALYVATFSSALSVFARGDTDWRKSSDDNLTAGCSKSQISCYNKQSLSSCGPNDYSCQCDGMKAAVQCLGDCNNGDNAYLASQQEIVSCQAASIFQSVSGNPSNSTGDDSGSDNGQQTSGDDKPTSRPSAAETTSSTRTKTETRSKVSSATGLVRNIGLIASALLMFLTL